MEPTTPVDSSSLQARLLGHLDVRVDGLPLPRLRTSTGKWLLCLLILRGDAPVDRSWLAGTLWPDSDDESAAANLRRALTDLRRALGSQSPRLHAPSPRTLGMRLEGAKVDVREFDAAVAHGTAESLRRAADLYSGPLLEGCYEPWVLHEREAREHAALSALEQVAEAESAAGRPALAADYLRRAVAIDPLREHTQRALMAALADAGDYAAAEAVYRTLRTLLRRELGVEPSPESVSLHFALKNRSRARIYPAPGRAATGSDVRPLAQVRGGLPRTTGPLVGRDKDARELRELVAPGTLVTLIGPGGVGKTRLAIEVARAIADATDDGARFVGLASLDSPSLVAPSIAAALGLAEAACGSADEIADRLASRDLLLVLDNCEHVAEPCAELARTLLERCENLRILATSRQPLGVGGEVVWEVMPLALPEGVSHTPPNLDPDVAACADAVRLFVERATRSDRRFRLTRENTDDVARVCNLIDGMPLAIELAAGWCGTLTPLQIAMRLAEPLELLVERRAGRPVRHASVGATAEWSYRLLAPELQRLFARLSVFRGGWTLDAAEDVCDATPALLAELRDRSLIQAEPRGREMRYRMLLVLRAFAERQLSAQERTALGSRHAAYYADITERADAALQGPDQLAWLERLDQEHGNVRAAISHSLDTRDISTALRLGAAMGAFWWRRGYWSEGRRHLTAILELVQPKNLRAADIVPYGRALSAGGRLATEQGDRDAGRELVERALTVLRPADSPTATAAALICLAGVELDIRHLDAAARLFDECLALRDVGLDEASAATALRQRGLLALRYFDFDAARGIFAEALTASSDADDARGIATSLMNLGDIALTQKDLDAARGYFNAALKMFEQLGDERGIGITLNNLADVEVEAGNAALALGVAERSLRLWRDLGHPYGIADALFAAAGATYRLNGGVTCLPLYAEAWRLYRKVDYRWRLARVLVETAIVSDAVGQIERAVSLCGAARAINPARWRRIRATRVAEIARILARARRALGADHARTVWSRGRSMASSIGPDDRAGEIDRLLTAVDSAL